MMAIFTPDRFKTVAKLGNADEIYRMEEKAADY